MVFKNKKAPSEFDGVRLTFALTDNPFEDSVGQRVTIDVDTSFVEASPLEINRDLLYDPRTGYSPNHFIDTTHRHTNWGASSDVYEVLVTIANDPFVSIFIGMLVEAARNKAISFIDAKKLARKAREQAEEAEQDNEKSV